MRVKREHGRILSVETQTRGSALAADVAAGATTITVDDAGDFDEDGGWLLIGDQVVEFATVDDDAGTITLATALTAAGGDGDPVHVWSPLYEETVDYQVAHVQLDGEFDNLDPVEAEVAEGVDDLWEGDRGGPAESCTLHRIAADEWEVVSVGGRPRKSRGLRFEADDSYAITDDDITATVATMPLSHAPIEESLKAFWNGVFQPPTEYTIDYDTATATFPLSGFEKPLDSLWVHYAYRTDITAPTSTVTDPPYSDEQIAAAIILPISAGIFMTGTGAGGGHGSTSVTPAEGDPVWAPGSDGAATVGAYYSSDFNFYGAVYGWVDQDATLPAIAAGDNAKVHMVAMLKFEIPHPSEYRDEDLEWHSGGSVADWARISMWRNGTNAGARSSGIGFEWEGWKMLPVDFGDLALVYQGLRAGVTGLTRLSVLGAFRDKPIGVRRQAANWIVSEAALMVIPDEVVNP